MKTKIHINKNTRKHPKRHSDTENSIDDSEDLGDLDDLDDFSTTLKNLPKATPLCCAILL